jgi:peptidoglycan/LPS O-acetylase OafA/YrhL
LFFECLASLAFPWLLRATDRLLITLMVLSGAAVMAYALANTNLNVGNNWNTWPLGSIRVAYPFIAGICLCRYSLKSHRQKSASGLKSIACVVLLVAIFFVQVPESMNGIYEAAAVLVLLPALMMFSASLTPTSRSRHFIVWLGAISYPLYATHYFVIRTVAGILRRLEGVNPWHYGIVVTGTVAACLLIAWLCLRKIDEPVRRWLTVRVSMAGRMRRASVG